MPEPTFTTKQNEALDHPVRKRIYDYLLGEQEPKSLGAIKEGCREHDIAITHHQLNRLVHVGLVEKVWGTNLYRVVER